MDSSKFLQKLYRCTKTDDFIEIITGDGYTMEQRSLVLPLYYLSAIGEDGDLSNGMTRLRSAFPANFDDNGVVCGYGYGKQKAIKHQASNPKFKEVARLVVEEKMTINAACDKTGADKGNYYKYRKKWHKPFLKVHTVDFVDQHTPEEWLYRYRGIFP